jgi:geranylgeranylglycerol-phosphate geranylgeranyltransferase
MKIIKEIFKLTRIEHSIILVIAVIIGEIIVGKGVFPGVMVFVASLITPIFISMAAFAINDYFDIEVDTVNKKNRPLVTGAIKPIHALYITVICLAIGITASAFINIEAFTIAVIFGILAMIYSIKLKEILLIGNTYIGFSMAIPLIFGNYVISPVANYTILLLALMIFLSGFAREVHGTIRDLKGDSKIRNAKTLPKVMGARKAAVISFISYLIAIVISIYLFFYLVPFKSNYIYLFLISITDIILLYISLGFIVYSKQKFYEKTRNMSLFAMVLALIGIFAAIMIYL